ncbi:hypothetical protein M501DRAFT_1010146 [Patellaria atrata CBS 101060]|uniref:Uncharacterized protein n=1 Tax=Patellaria atrata CBS 101060 TaxID=1346257 RepID=A0A9P4SEA7_9PEZI|nr:hypothetical protein M501DRAFT_1010146 [Patellaria atrata CBS 101060]
MYKSLQLPWSPNALPLEVLYRISGLVNTKGTIFLLPPPSPILRASFSVPPRPRSTMSSGAIALCKHFERGGASSEHGRPHPFWVLPKGSNANKDRIAGEILEEMLQGAVWRNVMLLHKGVAVYEIRNGKGYGMRWTLDVEETGREKEAGLKKGGDMDMSKEQEEFEEKIKEYRIKKTTFRGFVEPIIGMDHELPIS